jgi:hypothetical protein
MRLPPLSHPFILNTGIFPMDESLRHAVIASYCMPITCVTWRITDVSDLAWQNALFTLLGHDRFTRWSFSHTPTAQHPAAIGAQSMEEGALQSWSIADDMWVTRRDKCACGSFSLLRCVERPYPPFKLRGESSSHVNLTSCNVALPPAQAN